MHVLVTGSSGLIGSEAVAFFDRMGFAVTGVDNNMRADFFGPKGDTTWNRQRLESACRHFTHRTARHPRPRRGRRAAAVRAVRPDHPRRRPAQPRPGRQAPVRRLRRQRRRHAEPARSDAPPPPRRRVHPHEHEQGLRRRPEPHPAQGARRPAGTTTTPATPTASPKTFTIDRCLHSLFGASKLAGDVLAQEYGRYFGLKTGIFRGGCLTGPQHSGVELHGFLNYLVDVGAPRRARTRSSATRASRSATRSTAMT